MLGTGLRMIDLMRALAVVLLLAALSPAQEANGERWKGKTLPEWEGVVKAGAPSPEAVEALLLALGNGKPEEQRLAAKLLGRVRAKRAVPELLRIVKRTGSVDSSGWGHVALYEAVGAALAQIAPDADAVRTALLDADMRLGKPYRTPASVHLCPTAVPALLKEVGVPGAARGTIIVRTLGEAARKGRLGKHERAAREVLLKAVNAGPSMALERAAVLALCWIDPADPRVVLVLAEVAGGPPCDAAEMAALALARWAAFDCRALDSAVSYLKRKDLSIGLRFTVAETLSAVRLKTAERVDRGARVLDAMASKDRNDRLGAALTLAGMRPPDARAVERLMAALDDPDVHVRRMAIRALGQIGTSARAATARLRRIVASEDHEVGKVAAEALGRIGEEPEELVRLFITTLYKTDANLRLGAAQGLKQLGPAAKAALPVLVRIAKSKRGWDGTEQGLAASLLPSAATEAIGAIGPEAAEATPALVELLAQTKCTWDKWDVVKALGKIGGPAEPAVPALLNLLEDERVDRAAV